MSGGWGCPQEIDNKCKRVKYRPCNPGMKGCILAGRFIFSDDSKNTESAINLKKTSQDKK